MHSSCYDILMVINSTFSAQFPGIAIPKDWFWSTQCNGGIWFFSCPPCRAGCARGWWSCYDYWKCQFSSLDLKLQTNKNWFQNNNNYSLLCRRRIHLETLFSFSYSLPSTLSNNNKFSFMFEWEKLHCFSCDVIFVITLIIWWLCCRLSSL